MRYINKIVFGLACVLAFNACEIDTVENPNAPTAESLLNGATLADLRLLSHGVESIMRNDMQFHYWTTSIVGREYWDLNGTDPRYTGELLGAEGAILDNNGFLTTRAFAAAYKTTRNAINLEVATDNAEASLTDAEVNGIKGYARTIRAYALSLELSRQYQNGIRLDVADPDNPGPFVSYDEALEGIADLLDDASSLLQAGGDEFVFDLSSGFTGFDTPATFDQFNRALRARIAMYQEDYTAMRSALDASFYDDAGDLSAGVYHTFGAGGNDRLNPLFNVPNNDLYTVHPTFLDEATEGDSRVDAKTTPYDPTELDLPVSLDGLSGDVQVTIYSSNTDIVGLIRNEELILMDAEYKAMNGDGAGAVSAINIVRNAAGIGDYTGGTDEASLVNEILTQRRYSLFGEGHRWVDMRRFGRISEIPTDRDGDVVHVQFPTPILELE